jgi:hypothetical protein
MTLFITLEFSLYISPIVDTEMYLKTRKNLDFEI